MTTNQKRLINHHLNTFFGTFESKQKVACQFYPLQSQPANHDNPKVYVCYHHTGDCLHISFYLKKNRQHTWLTLEPFSTKTFGRQPKKQLWQHHCFECFLQLSQQTGYFEINVSPNGDFNIYEFDDYRTPNSLPPPSSQQEITVFAPDFKPITGFEARHFAVKLADPKLRCQTIQLINLCTILYHHQQPIFYAICHALPADFHDKNHWQVFALC